MVIKPKIRGFICTTTHPVGCEQNVRSQIASVRADGPIANSPKRVLVIGASSGYGMASRITAAFGGGASTIGVFFEKPATEKKPGTAGWHNAAAFAKCADEEGLYNKSFNGDAFSHEMRAAVIETIKEDLGQVDMVVYSLASPVRKMPDSGEVIRSVLKPIGEPYKSTAIDTNKDQIINAEIEAATEEEIAQTVTVMGGEDWELWINALGDAGVLADGAKSVAYSYIGTEITWPIYWHGALGRAKQDLDRAATAINDRLATTGGRANIAVLKSVVTQASSAIPVMPLYLSMVFKIMKEEGVHEGVIDQINRLFRTRLLEDSPETDDTRRLRLDDWELRKDIQDQCVALWPEVTSENLFELTDYAYYKLEFLRLFGFELDGIDYEADVQTDVPFDVISI